jgi:hypothetical protein
MLCNQQQALPIINFDFFGNTTTCDSKHGKLLPNSFRAIFCGPSGCGKTNALLSLVFSLNGLRFENVYVYSKSLYQPKYELLKLVLKRVKGVKYFPFNNNDEVIDPSEAHNNSLFIFDDVACDGQNKIKEYYSMCRHKAIDVAYLCQTYSKIPKQLIRDNCNFIVLFRQDEKNLKHIFNDHVSPDLSYHQFKQMCADCWKENDGCLVIAKDFSINYGRYRKKFDKYIKI